MRNLRSAAAIFIGALYALHAPSVLRPQDLPVPAPEAAAELFSTELGDSEVSLFLAGSWKGAVSSSWGAALTPLGLRASSDRGPLLFVQETDITLSLWVRERWFVEASFLDDYDLNTYRAGYQGKEGELVQYAGVGNTGLDFPIFPYLDLGGDTPNSFGAYGKFGSGPLTFHALARYDGAAVTEKVFQGSRERTEADLDAAAHLRGRSFVLPDADLDSVPVVYLEDSGGSISGSDGRKWRRASPGEYAASAAKGLVELASVPAGRVAAAYAKGGDSAPWTASLGSYGTAAAPGLGFLGDVQAAFADIGRSDANLAEYPQPGSALGTSPAAVVLAGTPALIIHERGAFSPFERRSRYEAPSPSVQGAALVRSSTGDRIAGYLLEPAETLQNAAAGGAESRGTYELFAKDGDGDRRAALARWPLLALAPDLYLPGRAAAMEDLVLRFVSYGASGAYDIGTDAVPGSVQVYRNGFIDGTARYDPASGLVTFPGTVGSDERIRIVYLRRADERRFGSLAAGLGAVYADGGPLDAAAAIGLRWNLSSEAYSAEGSGNPGTVGLGGRVGWTRENLGAQVAAGLAYEQTDTTNLYRAAGMEGAELDLEWNISSAFPSEEPKTIWEVAGLPYDPLAAGRAPLAYRDYQSTDLLGTTTLKPIEWDGAQLVSGREGPYAVSDPAISSRAATAEFILDEDKPWTGYQIPLGEDAAALENAKELIFPFRFYDAALGPNTSLQVWAQAGDLADKGSGGAEAGSPAAAWKIYDSAVDGPPSAAWTLRKITLNDQDRRLLADAGYVRILALRVESVATSAEISGRLLSAPPIAVGAMFRAVAVGGDGVPGAAPDGAAAGVAAVERLDPALRAAYPTLIDRIHGDGSPQRVLAVSWADMDPGYGAGADGRTARIPLADYRKLSFFVKGPQAALAGDAAGLAAAVLRFSVARGPGSLAPQLRDREVALEAEIPLSAFEPGRWSKVELRYGAGERSVTVDGRKIADADLIYRRDVLAEAGSGAGGRSGYTAIFLDPLGGTLPDGSFSVDEILLEESAPYYRANFGTALRWQRPGTVLELGGRSVMSDLAVDLAMEGVVRGDPEYPSEEAAAGVLGRAAASTTLLGTKVRGNVQLSSSDQSTAWSGGHGIDTPLGPLTLAEEFSMFPSDETLRHAFKAFVSSPASLRASIQAELNRSGDDLRRRWEGSVGYADTLVLETALAAQWTEEIPESAALPQDYAGAWNWTLFPMLPDMGTDARLRTADTGMRAGLDMKPLGVFLSAEGESAYNGSFGTIGSEGTVGLEFPFQAGVLKGALSTRRTIGRTVGPGGEDIGDDGNDFMSAMSDSRDLWLQPPLYPLFGTGLRNSFLDAIAINPENREMESARMTENLSLNLAFPPREGPRALYIPVAVQGSVERRIVQNLDTPTDELEFSTGMDFSALNLFGAFGYKPLFDFYRSDELSHSLEGGAIFSDAEETRWRLQAGQVLGFYGFLGAQLEITHVYTLLSTGWSDAATAAWTIPSPKSLLSALYDHAINRVKENESWPALSGLAEMDTQRLRRVTFEMTLDHTGEGSIAVRLGHESIVRVQGRLDLSAFANLSAQWDRVTDTTTVLAIIGTSLLISY